MVDLDPQSVSDYFSRPGTVEEWWHPDTGPLAFHYDAEVQVLEDNLEIDPGWQVLDVGTGRGRFGAHMARHGCSVVGVDANAGMLEAARETATRAGVADRFELRQGKAEDLAELGAGRFDLVMCMELFDHLPDLGRVLDEMRRTLKPDGRLAFTYVPAESLYGRVGDIYRWLSARRGGQRELISRTYRQAEIAQLMSEHGLVLDRYWGVGVLCVSAQTRLFTENPIMRSLTALARAEARRWPYHSRPWLARHGAHVVGLARPAT